MKNPEKQRTPRWMRRLVRTRMGETGENYTTALRAVKAEHQRRVAEKEKANGVQ